MLQRIAQVWGERRADIKAQSADTMRQLAEATRSQGGGPLHCFLAPTIKGVHSRGTC